MDGDKDIGISVRVERKKRKNFEGMASRAKGKRGQKSGANLGNVEVAVTAVTGGATNAEAEAARWELIMDGEFGLKHWIAISKDLVKLVVKKISWLKDGMVSQACVTLDV